MQNNLYIVGNGFDRYHGLDTRYQSFAFFLKQYYSEVYDLLIQYFPLPDLDPNNGASFSDPLWNDFENALAKLDFETVLDDNSDYLANPSSPDFRDRDWHSFQIEMQGIADILTKKLTQAFREFILKVFFPDSVENKLIRLQSNSVFLNFNYTDTLEKYYFIDREKVLYIHGEAKLKNEKLILGHGVNPKDFKEEKKTPPEGLSDEDMERWEDQMSNDYDFSYDSGKNEIMSYFNRSFKSTREIIEKNVNFFEASKNSNKILVLGHSISEVDQPYFEKIIHTVNNENVPWIVSYYFESEGNSHLNKLKLMGLKQNQIQLVKMEDLRPNTPTLYNA
jgi:Bacteriophage abortive infection AbiH